MFSLQVKELEGRKDKDTADISRENLDAADRISRVRKALIVMRRHTQQGIQR